MARCVSSPLLLPHPNTISDDCHRRDNLSAHLDPDNSGVLVVKLNGEGGGMSADEVTRRLDKGETCVVM